jgi:uncharacterized protein (TIGR04255 family)
LKLRNPPIVEAWIEFHFRGSDTEVTWPQGLDLFFQEIVAEYPTIERHFEESFQVVERAPGGMPKHVAFQGEIRRMRAFDAPRHSCVQTGQDTLAVNLIKGTGPYEGFRLLLPTALAQLVRYVRVFRPQSVLSAALHYTDVVTIPRNTDEPARLEDHFRIGVQVPDEKHWLLGRVAIEIGVPLATNGDGTDQLVLGFRREPTRPASREDRFRMDWHAVCSGLNTVAADILRTRLQAMHDALKRQFQECFTERTWAMFGEEAEA